MRAVIYARVSTRDQETQNQLDQLSEYADRQEWKVVDVITDMASGAKSSDERVGLRRVFDMARRRKIDLVLFWSLDRLSREGVRKTLLYLTELDGYGVKWHSYSEAYLSSLGVFSDAIIAILSALARQERIRLSERTRAGLERARKQGKRLGRPRTDPAHIERAKELRTEGLSYAKIGEALGCSRARACQLCKTA